MIPKGERTDTRDFLNAYFAARDRATSVAQRLSAVGLDRVADMCWALVEDIERLHETHEEVQSRLTGEYVRSANNTLPLMFMGICAGRAMGSDDPEERKHLVELGNAVRGDIEPMVLPEETDIPDFSVGGEPNEGNE